jgi:uncharacterized protein (TIGR03000 family)
MDSCGSSGGGDDYVTQKGGVMQKGGGVMQKGGVTQKGGAMQKGGMMQDSGAVPGEMTLPPTPPAPSTPPAPASAARANQATLTVSVPSDAKVYVNGQLTRSTGAERRYVSRGLRNDVGYVYEVRAEWTRDGETLQQTKVVRLESGAAEHLAFDFTEAAETTLTINVPEDARVTLAGHEINGAGAVRVFTTDRLSAGQTWSDYAVEASVVRDGRTLSQSKSITLRAGEAQTVSFDFETEHVAAAR